ncbi:sulfatase-like hydrolase/transferase [Natrinema altunense]|uniref:Sulfatase N-terminal domain-containing protein n=1 Tax=Natrinema altunense TaxID=222984 RepID=A0A482XUJ4_9EURY|nr:sulfatase-like hydrolase/transferase [Natrinema altunense]RZH67021.1 hypothetical protein ELS17_14710 [Natrinema altunense]
MTQKPNILWLTLESVRADHTTTYGYERETTPNIEAVSERSDATVLSTAVSQSMWTPASTASILTGTYLSTHQLGQDGKAQQKLRTDIRTFPQLLSNMGYETKLFTPNIYISSSTGLDRGFDDVENLITSKDDFLPTSTLFVDNWCCAARRLFEMDGVSVSRYKNDVIHNKTDIVPSRFRRWKKDRSGSNQPFFAYAHLHAPHHPYLPIGKYRDIFDDDLEMSIDEAYSLVDNIYDGSDEIKRRMARGLDLDQHEWNAIRALYDAETRLADHIAGKVIEEARDMSDRDLIIIITSDHGDLFGEYGLLGHNLVLHDGLIRVPLVISGINDIADGPDITTQHIDVVKTLASITGVETEQFEGRDIRNPDRRFAISQRGVASVDSYTEHDPNFRIPKVDKEPLTAVRSSQYKYLESTGVQLLYDLPNEETDISETHPEMCQEFSDVLDEQGITWDHTGDRASSEFDDAARQRLRDLGYITD